MNTNNFVIKKGKSLDRDLRAIGFNLKCDKQSLNPDIELSLVSASVEAINNKDNRLGGLLVDWISYHYKRINVDRLTKVVFNLSDVNYRFVKIFWCANAQRLFSKDQRFWRLSRIYRKSRRLPFVDRFSNNGNKKTTSVLIKIKGEDERFKKTCIRVPRGYFSLRPQQILPASIIAKNHLCYRYRVMMGASYRADVWAVLENEPNISAYALAKKGHCSYRTAYIAKKDYELLNLSVSLRKG